MDEGHCHYCEQVAEVWECYGCKRMTCEDCFAPMSPMATDPTTDCLECTEQSHRARVAEADREYDRLQAEKERKDLANRKSRERYHRPENVVKRRKARAERKRLRAETNLRNLVESFKIVGGMMR